MHVSFERMVLIFLLAFPFFIKSQNTIGLLQYNPSVTSAGYNLLFPYNQPTVFLLDNCGQIIHTWEDDDNFRPGNMAYLLPNGNLIKCKRDQTPINDPIWAGGGGAIVEMRNWENELLWSFEQNNTTARLHHDIAPMPNGNILMIAWESKSETEALAAGRNPELIAQQKLWPDYVLEYNPFQNLIVWEWHAWDHLIQDFDPSKENFGTVSDHPERIDLNWDTHNGHPDWLHINAIDYNPVLDQIMLTVPYFNEFWIIDHSTTTAEASGQTGGTSGKGGDLLYRWGNPITYGIGTVENQQLFFPHDAHWITPDALPGEEHFGKLAVFNNRVGTTLSTANILTTSFDPVNQAYLVLENNNYYPETFDRTIIHPEGNISAYSNAVSSVQMLPNDNVLICAGRWGYSYEITPNDEMVWEYITPLNAGMPVEQGSILNINDNLIFRLKRYPVTFGAFDNKNLTPGGYLELNPNTAFCNELTITEIPESEFAFRTIYPNPVKDFASIDLSALNTEMDFKLFDINGTCIRQFLNVADQTPIDFSALPDGAYFLKNDNHRVIINFIKI